MNLERLGDIVIWVVIVEYLIATLAYLFGRRGWDAIYWGGCALINIAVLMLKKHS